jgi:hypothetical protein
MTHVDASRTADTAVCAIALPLSVRALWGHVARRVHTQYSTLMLSGLCFISED